MVDGRDIKRGRRGTPPRPLRGEQHQSDRIGAAGNTEKNATRGLPRPEECCDVPGRKPRLDWSVRQGFGGYWQSLVSSAGLDEIRIHRRPPSTLRALGLPLGADLDHGRSIWVFPCDLAIGRASLFPGAKGV